jgi:Na+/melibiose symporter-like transporter
MGKTATNSFNLGGLIGTLLTIPIAKILGRKKMFFIYYLTAAVAIMCAFGLDLLPHARLYMYFPIGLTVFWECSAVLPTIFPNYFRPA